MSAATAEEPGRRAGAAAGPGRQRRAAGPGRRAAPPSAQRPVATRQQRPGAAQGRPPVAAPGGTVPGQKATGAPPDREPRTVPGQQAAPGLLIAPVAGHLAVVVPRQRAGTAAGQRGTAIPERWDNTADGRGRPGAARPQRPALTVVPPQPAAKDEWPEAPAPVRKPGVGADERERRAACRAPRQPVEARRIRTRPRTRLTRRGRIVVSALVIAAMLLVAVLAWIGVATRAEAAGSGPPPSAVYRNLTKVVVEPGESLWTIAAQAEPAADPRSVIQQIIDLNALGGTSIQPGERLWVPRS
jgi:LysM domain